MGHTWINHGSTIGHVRHVWVMWVNHGSYMGHMGIKLGQAWVICFIYGSKTGNGGQTWIIWVNYGSYVCHKGCILVNNGSTMGRSYMGHILANLVVLVMQNGPWLKRPLAIVGRYPLGMGDLHSGGPLDWRTFGMGEPSEWRTGNFTTVS